MVPEMENFARERSDADRILMRKARFHDDYHKGMRRDKRRPPSPSFTRGGRDSRSPMYGEHPKRMKREHWESLNDDPLSHGQNLRQPPSNVLVSFKQFLNQQNDAIDEVEAVERYAEYKNEFRRKQVEEFFDKHKDEEWFKSKYHPKDLAQQKELTEAHLQARLKAFKQLLELGWLDDNPLELQNQAAIMKTMDAATILMEGGSYFVLEALDASQGTRDESPSKPKGSDRKTSSKRKDLKKKKAMDLVSEELTPEQLQQQQQAQKYKNMRMSKDDEDEDDKNLRAPGESDDDEEQEKDEELPKEDTVEEEEAGEGGEEGSKEDGSAPPQPRSLHITRSVYLKKVPPAVNTEDIEQVCRTIPGYLRLAFSEPVPEKEYERRCWVTFEHTTNIKEVIARITANPIKGQTLECASNRDLPRRVKLGSKASYMHKAVLNDVKLAKKMIEHFDKKGELWKQKEPGSMETLKAESEENETPEVNPVLSIMPALEEDGTEGSGDLLSEKTEEDEEGISVVDPSDKKEGKERLLKGLDLMLWYLRIVHSVDFYGNSSVPSEDIMPHRCGVFTARNSRSGASRLHQDEIDEYILSMEKNLDVLIRECTSSLQPEEVAKLGKKTYDTEVEKFIETNTEKILDDKYRCPLSGKKFKAPDFVRKHIFNKHMDRVEAVKLQVDCYNNYLKDPERPMTDTIQPAVSTPTGLGGGMGWGLQSPPEMMRWMQGHHGPAVFGQGMYPQFGGPVGPGAPSGPGVGRGGRPARGGPSRGSSRSTVSYRDLDNPTDMDF